MHGSAGLHSAMAIKRQRRMREQAKRRAAAERRLSSRTDSFDSVEHFNRRPNFQKTESYQVTSIGLLHIGVCFLALGLFLIGSGLLPEDLMTWRTVGWWNELVVTGLFVTAIGVFLIILNKFVSRREEDELEQYVQSQLTRSRSGHRLERDVETGGLTTKHHRRALEKQREQDKEKAAAVHSPLNRNAPQTALNGDIPLEKILEEDLLERVDLVEIRQLELKENLSTTTTASVSPGTPSETRELLINGRQYSFNSRQY